MRCRLLRGPARTRRDPGRHAEAGPGELGSEAFQRYIASEKDRLADLVKRAGIQAE